VAPGGARLALEIENEVASLGELVALAAVFDGAPVFRDAHWRPGQRRSLGFASTGGRHQLCVVARYEGRAGSGSASFLVRAPRLVDLVEGSAVSVRVSLQEQLGDQPHATARYSGGDSYAPAAGEPDVDKYVSRLDEICAGRW
jgi:hypothetical protein